MHPTANFDLHVYGATVFFFFRNFPFGKVIFGSPQMVTGTRSEATGTGSRGSLTYKAGNFIARYLGRQSSYRAAIGSSALTSFRPLSY